MRRRRFAKVAGAAAATLSVFVLSAAPASAHYREYQFGNVVGAVSDDHRSYHACELGPGYGIMLFELTDGQRYRQYVNDQCTPSTGVYRNINAFKLGWDQGGGIIWSNWIAP